MMSWLSENRLRSISTGSRLMSRIVGRSSLSCLLMGGVRLCHSMSLRVCVGLSVGLVLSSICWLLNLPLLLMLLPVHLCSVVTPLLVLSQIFKRVFGGVTLSREMVNEERKHVLGGG